MGCSVMQEVTVATVGTAAEVIGKVAETTSAIVGCRGVMDKSGGGKGLVATGRGIEDMEGSDDIHLAGLCKKSSAHRNTSGNGGVGGGGGGGVKVVALVEVLEVVALAEVAEVVVVKLVALAEVLQVVVALVEVAALVAFLTVLPLLAMAANPSLTLVMAAICLDMPFLKTPCGNVGTKAP